MRRRKITERSLHGAIVDWLRLVLPPEVVFSHSPGEGKRGWMGQRDLMSSGYKQGWPDLEFVHEGRVHFVEIKSPDGRLSLVQIACHMDLARAGSPPQVVKSIEDVREFLRVRGIPMRPGVQL